MAENEKLICPVHGEVEGLSVGEGPMSETHPWALLCEKCEPQFTVVVGYELDGHGIKRRWEDFGRAVFDG